MSGSNWPGKCPHCGNELLTSEDRGLHCDGCDDLTGEDIDAILSKFTDASNTGITGGSPAAGEPYSGANCSAKNGGKSE
jgi:hypothetical protein